ncbi:PAC2 family protein [Candidatus Woesearchaeota archaeon]|nr:PAC2 family protein [Candidatus Woesearchaeota archaeon]
MISIKQIISKIERSNIWYFKYFANIAEPKKSILIEGLPGIGNVGKIAVDFLIDEIEAKKILEITSSSFPHSVFVNEDNLVELPKVQLFYKKIGSITYLFLSGDIQPPDEVSCYEFSQLILDLAKKLKCTEVITLGGLGLESIEKTPKMYCTGNSTKIIKEYKIVKNITDKLYGVVGPIMGVSGLLVGLAESKKMDAVCILAETINHPLYLGIKGAREILKLLSKKFPFKVNIKKLDKEIKTLEANMIISSNLSNSGKSDETGKISYIG